ncbi:acid phosphatase/Vanadium-dependent haloperoxidase [Wallemia mellicola]|nr:acid phosphatase/Vanadium-dependent haloperoxidase [Wallemia mellicola]
MLVVYFAEGGITDVVMPIPARQYFGKVVHLGPLYYLYMAMLSTFCTNSINILAGASLALLFHNWYPARVFPGDTFCYFAGMAFAIVGVLAHFSKTLLLFFIPQIFNFVFSTPQLFGLVPCPRHRVPRYIHENGKLQPSYAIFEEVPPSYVSIPLKLLTFVNLVKIEKDREGNIKMATNLTLLNGLLCFFGNLINNVHGYWREFDVNDVTIRHTYATEERVPMTLLGIIIGLIPLVCLVVLSTQWYRSYTDLHHSILGFLLTISLTISTTTSIKVLAGRMRPDFIDRCQPTAGSVNADVGLSTAAICTQTDFNILQDGFRSFPSGHSSSSFALLGYFSFYLAGKMQIFDTKGHTIKSWICWTPWIGAVLIAVSRTMDYRHHATDVIAGAIIGSFFAYVCYRQYYPHLGEPLSHKPHNSRYIEANDAYRLPTHQTEGYGLERVTNEPQLPQQSHTINHARDRLDEVHLNEHKYGQ